MSRQGQYSNVGGNVQGGGQMQHLPGQRMQLEAFTPERERPYLSSKVEAQWRNSVSSQLFNEGQAQAVDSSGSYFHGKLQESKLVPEKQDNMNLRSKHLGENMQVGFEEKTQQTSEGLQDKLADEIIKLTNEHNEAEDAENVRHRERLNAINDQYKERLLTLRIRHGSRREEFLRKESVVQQRQYQAMMENQTRMGFVDAHGYSSCAGSTMAGDIQRPYGTDQFEPYREHARFVGAPIDHGLEPTLPFGRGQIYDTSTRFGG